MQVAERNVLDSERENEKNDTAFGRNYDQNRAERRLDRAHNAMNIGLHHVQDE